MLLTRTNHLQRAAATRRLYPWEALFLLVLFLVPSNAKYGER